MYKQNPRLYGSYWYDSTLGLYFMKTRLYDSELGRFLSKDQVSGGGSALDFNPYLYCSNNPISRIDPSGKGWWSKVTNFVSNAYHWVKKEASAAVTWVVNTTTNAWDAFGSTMAAGVDYYTRSSNKVVRWLANKTNAAADWTGGSPSKALFAGVAISAAVIGGAAAVGAAIEYVKGLGGYRAVNTAAKVGGGGIGYTASKILRPALEKNGGVLAGLKEHGVDQVISRGISPQTILNTIRYPGAVSAGVSKYGYQFKYFGEQVVIVVNEVGKIVTGMLR